jgi:hypothetical protein
MSFHKLSLILHRRNPAYLNHPALIAAILALFLPGMAVATSITLLATGQAFPSGLVVSGTNLYFASSIGGAAQSVNTIATVGGAVSVLYPNLVSPNSLAVIGSTLYWIDANSGPITDTQILSAPLGGGGPVNAIYTGSNVGEPIVDGSGIATDGASLYTADEVQGRVHRLNPDGTGLTQLGPNRYGGFFDTEHQNSIATAGGLVYVLDAGRSAVDSPQLVTIPVGGGASFTPVVVGAPFNAPTAITIGGGQIFVGDGNTIWTLPLGGGPPTVFFSGGPLVNIGNSALVYNNGSLYVGDQGANSIFRIDIPEPATLSLFMIGLIGVWSTRMILKNRGSVSSTDETIRGIVRTSPGSSGVICDQKTLV